MMKFGAPTNIFQLDVKFSGAHYFFFSSGEHDDVVPK